MYRILTVLNVLSLSSIVAATICDDPNAMLNPTTTAGQYCTKMSRLNLLIVAQSACWAYVYLTGSPRGWDKSTKPYPSLVVHGVRYQSLRCLNVPYDPAIVGLHLLFHTVWILFDHRYPSSVMSAGCCAFLVTFPLLPLVALMSKKKRLNYFSSAGGLLSLFWLSGVVFMGFPRLNWTLWNIKVLQDSRIWPELLGRLRESRTLSSIPLLAWINIVVGLVLGVILMCTSIDGLLPVSGYIDLANGEFYTPPLSALQKSLTSGAVEETSPAKSSDEIGDVQSKTDGAKELRSVSRLAGYYGPERMDLTTAGYAFVVQAVTMFLVCVQRSEEDIVKGLPSLAIARSIPAFLVTGVGSIVVSVKGAEERLESTKWWLRVAALYCFACAAIGALAGKSR